MALVILDHINKKAKKWFKKTGMLHIRDYFDETTTCFLTAATRNEALQQLVNLLAKAGKIDSPENFYRDILKREEIVSTGIGMCVAIPHAKNARFPDFFMALGLQKGPGIEWNSLDNAPVRLVCMVGGPDDRQDHYLRILSEITDRFRNERVRRELLSATHPQDLYRSFTQY